MVKIQFFGLFRLMDVSIYVHFTYFAFMRGDII